LEYLPTFWLNEYEVKFQPSHESAFLFDASSTIHCIISTNKFGVIEIAIA
jgi:hypothetical protein